MRLHPVAAFSLLLAACTDYGAAPAVDAAAPFPATLLVASVATSSDDGTLAGFDLASGRQRAGVLEAIGLTGDAQVLADGTVLFNLTTSDEVLALDARTMLARARLPAGANARPVRGVLAPARAGAIQLWASLDDGTAGFPDSSGAQFVDVTPGDPGYLGVAASLVLPAGHHEAAWSATRPRLVVGNNDCDEPLAVLSVESGSPAEHVRDFAAAEIGFDASTAARTCGTARPTLGGCASANGGVVCAVASTGDLVLVSVDADAPAALVLHTHGSGGGAMATHPGARYVYATQANPRGGVHNPSALCVIGQLVTVDVDSATVANETPLLYRGAGCADSLAGTDEENDEPARARVTPDGLTLLVSVAGGGTNGTGIARQVMVFDLSDPAHPAQQASIATGRSSGDHGVTLAGDARLLYVADNVDETVTVIDLAARAAVMTLSLGLAPQTLATFGGVEGAGF